MAYSALPTRTTTDVNASADVNTLQGNIDFIGGGLKEVASANYPITDTDGFGAIVVTTGASDRTITLPTLADNQNRRLKISKDDSGAGNVIIDGEGAELVNGFTDWILYNEFGFVELVASANRWNVVARDSLVDLEFLTSTGETITSDSGDKATLMGVPKASPTHLLIVPAGVWDLEASNTFDNRMNGIMTFVQTRFFLSTSPTSLSEDDFFEMLHCGDTDRLIRTASFIRKQVTNASSTTWYQVVRPDWGTGSTFNKLETSLGGAAGNGGSSFIRARRIA